VPAVKERRELFAIERGRTQLSETRFTQLPTGQCQDPQPVCLCRVAAIAVALIQRAQRIRQFVHRKLLLSCSVLSSIRSVLLPTRRSETPVRDKGPGGSDHTCCRKCGFRRTPCGEIGRRDCERRHELNSCDR